MGTVPIAVPSRSKIRSVLAFLAMHAGLTIPRDQLIAEYWPEAEPASARNGLKTALSAIRRSLREAGVDPDAFFVADRESVVVASDVDVDARYVELCSVKDDRARELAIALYAGEFLPGDHSMWAVDRRAKLAARFEELLRAELATRPSAELAERIVARDPFYDAAHVFLIDDALALGNRKRAVASFRRYAAALAELSLVPDAELARRVGEPEGDEGGTIADAPFIGRSRELAEIRGWIDATVGPPTFIVSGIAGIGKSSLVAAAVGSRDRDDVLVCDAPNAPSGEAATHVRTIVCTRPEHLAATRLRFPNARELRVVGLRRDEIAAALARASTTADRRAPSADAVWDASGGHPTLVAIALAKAKRDDDDARDLERVRLRPFEEQLAAAGDDGIEVVQLLALDAELDDDDLAALLDWSLHRVGDAIERLRDDGILAADRSRGLSFRAFEIVARLRLGKATARELTARIADRLRAHEGPRSLRRQARHHAALGRRRESAELSLEAGVAFATFGSSTNAVAAFDEGIAELDAIATSREASAILRKLYLKRGEALNQSGSFAAAIRSFDSALEVTDPTDLDDSRVRGLVSVKAAYAYTHLDSFEEAWIAVRQAAECSVRAGALDIELDADVVKSLLLYRTRHYEAAIEHATSAYDKAMNAARYADASTLAEHAGQTTRRLLRLDVSATWADRQLRAATLAAPDLKARAYLARAAAAYAIERYDAAMADNGEALRILDSIRRRKMPSPVPLGLLEWHCHYNLSHVLTLTGQVDDALLESKWLVNSPWTRNLPLCTIMTFATITDAAIVSGRYDECETVRRFAERLPPVARNHRAYFFNRLAEARIASIFELPEIVRPILRDSFDAIVEAEDTNLDQIHLSYEKLAEAARGVDEVLSARATAAAARCRRRLQTAAGPLRTASDDSRTSRSGGRAAASR